MKLIDIVLDELKKEYPRDIVINTMDSNISATNYRVSRGVLVAYYKSSEMYINFDYIISITFVNND